MGMPIITSGTCADHFGDLGKTKYYGADPDGNDAMMRTLTGDKPSVMDPTPDEMDKKEHAAAAEICKMLADDNSDTEDRLTWGGRCPGLSRSDKENGPFMDCWEDLPKEKVKVSLVSDASLPPGCFLAAAKGTSAGSGDGSSDNREKTILNYNSDTSGKTQCSEATPCVCAQSNSYCDAKKYVYAPPPLPLFSFFAPP